MLGAMPKNTLWFMLIQEVLISCDTRALHDAIQEAVGGVNWMISFRSVFLTWSKLLL